MKVSVPLSELNHKMNAISGVVPGKTTMPILSTVLMSAENGIFSISATDLDISVTSRVNGTVAEEGKIAAPAKKLAEIVKSLAGEVVALDTEGDKLTLSCGKSRFVMNARSAEDFPKLPKQEGKTSFAIDPEIVGALVQKTTYAVSTDLTRPALCGVLWEVDRKGISMVATDGHRLAKVEIALDLGSVQKMDVIVPPKALGTMRIYAEGAKEVRISIGENSISFDMKETTIYSRLLEGPFPNYQRVIPAKNEKELVVSRSALSEATKRVSILSDTLTQAGRLLDRQGQAHAQRQHAGARRGARGDRGLLLGRGRWTSATTPTYVLDILGRSTPRRSFSSSTGPTTRRS